MDVIVRVDGAVQYVAQWRHLGDIDQPTSNAISFTAFIELVGDTRQRASLSITTFHQQKILLERISSAC